VQSPTNIVNIGSPSAFTLWKQGLEAWGTLEAASELDAPEGPMQPVDQEEISEIVHGDSSNPEGDKPPHSVVFQRTVGTVCRPQ
jgi:hypothetical protein